MSLKQVHVHSGTAHGLEPELSLSLSSGNSLEHTWQQVQAALVNSAGESRREWFLSSVHLSLPQRSTLRYGGEYTWKHKQLVNRTTFCCSPTDPLFQRHRRHTLAELTPCKKLFFTYLDAEQRGADCIPVNVETLTGKLIPLQLPLSRTWADVKVMIQDKEGIPPDQQQLIFNNKQLSDDMPIMSSELVPHVKLYLVLRLRGGMHHISSGRVDYCSTEFNSRDVNGVLTHDELSRLPYAHNCRVQVRGLNGKQQSLFFHFHPACTVRRLSLQLRMETEPDYFQQLSREEMQDLVCNEDILLSMTQQTRERFAQAFCSQQ